MQKPGRLMKAIGSLPYGQTFVETLLELGIVIVFLKAYNMTRNLFGSQACTPQYALGHAEQIIWLERLLGIFWEQEIQNVALPSRTWIRLWNFFYGSAHMAVTVFVLVFLFILKPQAYQRCRTIFIVMNTFALIGYAAYPLMPPRLVNDCEDPYGGCLEGYSFVDTLEEIGGFWSWKQKGISKVSNHYAAMPSMHFGYSLWSSLSMHEYSPYSFFRALAVLYPFLTLYCIVVTANHFFLDAVFGAACYYVALKLIPFLPKVGRGSGLDLIPGGTPPAAPSPPGSAAKDIEMDEEALLPVTLADLQQQQQQAGGDPQGGAYAGNQNTLLKKR